MENILKLRKLEEKAHGYSEEWSRCQMNEVLDGANEVRTKSEIPKPSMAVFLSLFCTMSGCGGGNWSMDKNLNPSRADDLIDSF